MKRWVKWTTCIGIMLLLLLNSAIAQSTTLAFGYEIELPEGVEITNEEWNPENLGLIYFLEGTYGNGEELFELAWCDVTQRPSYRPSNRIKDGFNLTTETLWGSLMVTTGIDYEGPAFNTMFQQIGSFGMAIESALAGNEGYQEEMDERIFKNIQIEPLETYADLSEGEMSIQPDMSVSYENEKLVVTDGSGETLLWVSKLPRIDIYHYSKEEENKALNEMILSMPGVLESAGLSASNYVISRETLTANAWSGSRTEYCITAPAKDGGGFATLKVFNEGSQIVVYEGGGNRDEALAMAHSAIIFYKDSAEGKSIIPGEGYLLGDIEGEIITIPVAQGRYVVDIIDNKKEVPAEKREYQEVECEGGLKTTYGYTAENGSFREILTYEYLPMPEEFQVDVLTLTDEEYLALMEKAFEYLGNKYLSVLQEVIITKDGQPVTAEKVKASATDLMEMIDETEAAEKEKDIWDIDYVLLNNLTRARTVVGYFVPIDKDKVEKEHLAWNAGGKRWIVTRSFDLFGEDSINGYGGITLYDGALHLIEAADYRYPSYTFRKNDDAVQTITYQESPDAAKASAEGKRTAVVATKSSPLTLRKEPGENGAKILSIEKGETVTVLEDGDWPLVEYKGQQGYVNGKYLK